MRHEDIEIGKLYECRYGDYTDWDECKMIGFDGTAIVVAVDDEYVIAAELNKKIKSNRR